NTIAYTLIPFLISFIELIIGTTIIIYINLSSVAEAFHINQGQISGQNDYLPLGRTVQREQKPQSAANLRKIPSKYGLIFGVNFNKKVMLYEGNNSIGRGSDCDILINDNEKKISRLHAMIFVKGELVGIKAISKNSTYVNGERIEKTMLHRGDSISISSTNIKLT
ncbi:MAG: FHA domain-containing protein, partial [Ignavibacteriaceae bacterium]|nr:FHA domain-containing protein [Ignavibacteriaceae bacterium]